MLKITLWLSSGYCDIKFITCFQFHIVSPARIERASDGSWPPGLSFSLVPNQSIVIFKHEIIPPQIPILSKCVFRTILHTLHTENTLRAVFSFS